MTEAKELIEKIERSGQELFWYGEASEVSIERLEGLLNTRLPVSFRRFLEEFGGGGFVEADISGIQDDNPSLDYRGTVFGDTSRCREEFDLPKNLIVIYLGADDVVWCLESSVESEGESPVVSFDVYDSSVTPLVPSFENFFVEYLRLRLSRNS